MQCDIDWGIPGVERAAAKGDVVVVVDTLSFSSAVVTAIQQGVTVYPCTDPQIAATLAETENAIVSVSRSQVTEETPFSLSPVTYLSADAGTRVVLASPNGAACIKAAADLEYAFVGCLLNAQAVGSHIAEIAAATDKDIMLVAAGERAQDHGLPGGPRLLFAVEDYLGCGAILSAIMADYTAEAALCANAFLASQEHLEHLLTECLSGKQLIAAGFEADVAHSAQLNHYSCVPQLRGGKIMSYDAPDEEALVETPEPVEVEEAAVEITGETAVEPIETLEESAIASERDGEDVSEWPAELVALRDEALQCTRCELAETRTNVVFGEGNPKSKLVVVGEGPGDHEDQTGRPFVGRAGKLLDEAIIKAGLQREDLWICNVLKCRACIIEDGSVRNRPPKADEIKACRPWLEAQLDILKPSVILCIGAPSANLLIHKNFRMTQERGQWFTDSDYAPNMIAALHPAYILRQHGEPYEVALQSLVDDLKAAWERSQEPASQDPPPEKSQLTLF